MLSFAALYSSRAAFARSLRFLETCTFTPGAFCVPSISTATLGISEAVPPRQIEQNGTLLIGRVIIAGGHSGNKGLLRRDGARAELFGISSPNIRRVALPSYKSRTTRTREGNR